MKDIDEQEMSDYKKELKTPTKTTTSPKPILKTKSSRLRTLGKIKKVKIVEPEEKQSSDEDSIINSEDTDESNEEENLESDDNSTKHSTDDEEEKVEELITNDEDVEEIDEHVPTFNDGTKALIYLHKRLGHIPVDTIKEGIKNRVWKNIPVQYELIKDARMPKCDACLKGSLRAKPLVSIKDTM